MYQNKLKHYELEKICLYVKIICLYVLCFLFDLNVSISAVSYKENAGPPKQDPDW